MQNGTEVVSLPAPVRAADGREEDLSDALGPALLALTRLLCPADHLHVEVSGTLSLLPVGEGGELRVWSVWDDGRTFWHTAVLGDVSTPPAATGTGWEEPPADAPPSGIYVVTAVGGAGTPFVLTRTDADSGHLLVEGSEGDEGGGGFSG